MKTTMNKNIIRYFFIGIVAICVSYDSISAKSWFSRRRERRQDELEKQQNAMQQQTPVTSSKNTTAPSSSNLKQLLDAQDTEVVPATTQPVKNELQGKKPGTDIQEPKPIQETTKKEDTLKQQSIFDEDKYALPLELQHESPKKTPTPKLDHDIPYVELNFENADLENLIKQVEAIFEITFITDDMIDPLPKNSKALKGNKISFKTQEPLKKEAAWDLFLTFLDITGFAVVPTPEDKIYRIKQIAPARQSPIVAYIGTPLADLPDNDELIRYVYFVQNSTVQALQPIIDALRSRDAQLIVLNEHKAFILIDKAYNIKTLMNIIKELDQITMPQAMSVLKLQKADALQVKKLYDSLIQTGENETNRLIGPRKQPTSLYFPENTRIIAEPRTNSLILLGQQDAIKKIEEFIVQNVDIDLDQPYSPLNIYKLRYADAETVANIMTKVTEFGHETPAGKSGGVRGGDKYTQPMAFIPEKETNQLVIKGNYEDYMNAKVIIDELDKPQSQIAIEILILDVNLDDLKQMGTQLRSKVPGTTEGIVGNNVKFQTSGLFQTAGIQTNASGPGVDRLLANLISLAVGAPTGNTIVTLGQDLFGVWGIFQVLRTITNTQLMSNPFLVATNKTPAVVKLGQTRRVNTSEVISGTTAPTQGDVSANLEIKITPQINSDGMIILQLSVTIDQFTSTTDFTDANMINKQIITQTIVADKEVLALGGLIQNQTTDSKNKVPILGDIPILGWFFKNKETEVIKSNLLILLSAQIIRPYDANQAAEFTNDRIADYNEDRNAIETFAERRDPIDRNFFAKQEDIYPEKVDEFLFKRHNKPPVPSQPTKASTASLKKSGLNLAQMMEIDITPAKALPAQDIVSLDEPQSKKLKLSLQKKQRVKQSLSDFIEPVNPGVPA
jgi:general secretion pathway protein D